MLELINCFGYLGVGLWHPMLSTLPLTPQPGDHSSKLFSSSIYLALLTAYILACSAGAEMVFHADTLLDFPTFIPGSLLAFGFGWACDSSSLGRSWESILAIVYLIIFMLNDDKQYLINSSLPYCLPFSTAVQRSLSR